MSGIFGFAREQAGQPPRSLRSGLRARVNDQERLSAARHRLVAAGCAEERTAKFAPAQIVLLDEKRDYEVRRDERMKLLALPLWQIDSLACSDGHSQGRDALFADLVPDIIKLRRTQGRLEQKIALLRHVEAVRLYAAEHEGRLPARLSRMTVPLPFDPFTGKPFDYVVEGAIAHVRGSSIRSEKNDLEYDVDYEVTLQK
jgi:hypothetical protein